MHHSAKLFDLLTEPLELFLGNSVMLRVARFHVCFLELLEPRAILTVVARPDLSETMINPLGLSAQETQVVDMGSVESADQQYTMIQAFRSLMH